MPIFEFHCKECRKEFKTLRKADQLHEVACPSCGTQKVARLLSVPARSAASADVEACSMPMGGCCRMNDAVSCGCK
jgi:putative FmdB family regulatory protein